MELNPYLYYLVKQERRADAMRDAEQRRLIKSVKRCPEPCPEPCRRAVEGKDGGSPGWLQRLGMSLRRLVPVHPDGGAGEPRPGPRQTVSSPTH